ncbi:MAG: peptidase T [Bacteroidetes bacterium]|nr:MAG: peptidase T [Bacteroidota bacterium]
MNKLLDRFVKYVKIDTQSDENSKFCPSTNKQLNLANKLVEELKNIGLQDVCLDENGYVTASLPANIDKKVPTIGFIAHMDTSPDMAGTDVNPQIVENYDGEDIVLNNEKNIILSPKDFPKLKNYVGQTLITTDGNTLLGADDKAGIAEIITAVEFLVNNPDIKHGTVKVGFTPDEEIGRGADLFDVKKFNADFAYTVDGGELGELEYETFNAAEAKINITGRNIHPGVAKGKMINSILVAMELNSMLPKNQKPEYTTGFEGFFHLLDFQGSVDNTSIKYIIRDFDRDKFENKKTLMRDAVKFLNSKYGKNIIDLEMNDQYYNMKEKIVPVIEIVETAKKAMLEVGVEPKIFPVRGGTDGSKLSFMGLPTPNIFTGAHNYHGRFEYVPVQTMEKAVEVIVKIIELFGLK